VKQDRFLIGILIGIAVLIVVALVLFFSRQDTQTYRTDGSPDAVVFNYVLAINEKDYQKAYGYLADLEHKPTYEEFRKSFFSGMVNASNVGVDVGAASISGDEATVEVKMIYPSGDPFSSTYSNVERGLLVRQDGEWKLSTLPYNFWDYNWYQEPPAKP
jgi:hypothetical protein